MSAVDTLAEFVHSRELANPPIERFNLLKRHVLDTVDARVSGSLTDEGAAAAQVAASVRDSMLSMVLAGCAQARCTEVDDIHLTSCTTPGSVVVSTALALAAAGELTTMRAFAAAALAGYESMIRLGFAIDGPFALHNGVWPTYYTAAFGSAATACRAYGLSVDETAGALSTALSLGGGTPVASAPAMSSRWIALGIAAANGVLAARTARAGLRAAIAAPKRLTTGLGRRWLFDDIGMKPYPTARQALAAIEAALELGAAHDSSQISAIVVELPERQRAIVDRCAVPRTRFESIASVRYQIALALLEPERLLDVRRTPPFVDARVGRLMARIGVRRARDLDDAYPRTWPGRVVFRLRGGRGRVERLVRNPRGDARNALTWDDVIKKCGRARKFADQLRAATLDSPVPPLWASP
jgi:2-methylcitrate dehydratase PrpD